MNKIFMIKMMSQNLATPNRTAFTMPVLLQLFGRLAVKTSEGSRQDSTLPGQAIPSFLPHLKLGRARH